MGRDILVKSGASILCSPDSVIVRFPNGQSFNCSLGRVRFRSQMLLAASNSPGAEGRWADIYWALLEPEPVKGGGVGSLYQSWKKWIHMLHPYAPPPDPYHVTLYYDCYSDEVYQDAFSNEIEGMQWQINSSCILMGKQGVAAAVDLTPEQAEWYEMTQEAFPHVTLAVNVNHEARDLGPMIKGPLAMTDWIMTQIPNLQFSPLAEAYKLTVSSSDVAVLEHRQIEQFHGRENTDHPDSGSPKQPSLHFVVTGTYGCGFLSLRPSSDVQTNRQHPYLAETVPS